MEHKRIAQPRAGFFRIPAELVSGGSQSWTSRRVVKLGQRKYVEGTPWTWRKSLSRARRLHKIWIRNRRWTTRWRAKEEKAGWEKFFVFFWLSRFRVFSPLFWATTSWCKRNKKNLLSLFLFFSSFAFSFWPFAGLFFLFPARLFFFVPPRPLVRRLILEALGRDFRFSGTSQCVPSHSQHRV